MALGALKLTRPRLFSSHAELPLTHVRLVQVLAVAWLMTGQSVWWPAPAGWGLGWSAGVGVVSTALCGALLFAPFTRLISATLGALIVLEWVLVPTWFAHNRLFVAALLVTVSLSSARFHSWPRWQVGLVYLVAALDKAVQPAWRDGRFFESFVAQLAGFGLMWSPGGDVGAPNPLAAWLDSVGTRPLWTAAGLGVIAVELVLAVLFLRSPRAGDVEVLDSARTERWAQTGRWGAGLNVLFHVSVFALTGSTMGQFFFAGAAASLLLLKDDELPPGGGLMFTIVLHAGPWTHRALPVAALVLVALQQLRVSRLGRRLR